MIILGIDPGQKGAIAAMRGGDVLFYQPLPYIGNEINIGALVDDILRCRQGKAALAILEKVRAMPGQGVTSTFTFGQGYGELRGMLKTLGIPLLEPTPMQWKKEVLAGCDWKGNKAASCEFVMRRYPDVDLTPGRKVIPHDGIADAICLAIYGRQKGG